MKAHVAFCEHTAVGGIEFIHEHGSMTGTAYHPPQGWAHVSIPVEVDDWDDAAALIWHSIPRGGHVCRRCGLDVQHIAGHVLPCREEPKA